MMRHATLAPGDPVPDSCVPRLEEAGQLVAAAVYGQSIPVNERERYLCLAWARAEPPGRAAGARLVVRYNQQNGDWYEHHEKEPLVLVVTVPEGAARLVVLLHAENQEEGATALFDDAGVYRLPYP
jgi:hypothetical protein